MLSEQEADLMAESRPSGSESVSALSGDDMLSELESEIQARRESIENLKSEIAAEQQELAEKRAEIDKNRSDRASALGITTIIIVVLGLAAVVVFYFVGRKRRKTQ
jgi:t-SNARE complex subunit (syntaxin)